MCAVGCDSTTNKKVFLDFESKDCNECAQYKMLIDIKETQIDKAKTKCETITDEMEFLKLDNTTNETKIFDLSKKLAQKDKVLTEKDLELAKLNQVINALKNELSRVRTINGLKKEKEENNNQPKTTVKLEKEAIVAPIKSNLNK